MNEINKALEREKFEAWYSKRYGYDFQAKQKTWLHAAMCDAWEVWKAARASAPEPGAGQCGESCERAKLCGACARGLEEAREPVAWRTRYRSEPGMIGHYPWSYIERKPRGLRPELEIEPLYTALSPAGGEAHKPLTANEREAFEQWYRDEFDEAPDFSDMPSAVFGWHAWQARAERERISPDAWKQLGRDELMLEQGERLFDRSSDLTSDERIDEAVEAAWEKAEQETADGESPETEWARYGRHCYLAAMSASNQNGGE